MPNAAVTAEQLAAIQRIHEDLAARMTESWTRRFRFQVAISVGSVKQTTFGSHVEQLGNPCCSYSFGIAPGGGSALFSYDRSVLEGSLVEQLKGRKDLALESGQPMEAIHRRIMGPVITRELEDFEKAWAIERIMRVSDAEIEVDPTSIDLAGPDDDIIHTAFNVESGKVSGSAFLAYPLSTLEPLLKDLH